MNKLDKLLLHYYLVGFSAELFSDMSIVAVAPSNPIHLKAFKLGQAHAILGDDNPRIDKLGNEDILKLIKE